MHKETLRVRGVLRGIRGHNIKEHSVRLLKLNFIIQNYILDREIILRNQKEK